MDLARSPAVEVLRFCTPVARPNGAGKVFVGKKEGRTGRNDLALPKTGSRLLSWSTGTDRLLGFEWPRAARGWGWLAGWSLCYEVMDVWGRK